MNQFLQGEDITVYRAMRNMQGLINLLSSTRERLASQAMWNDKIIAHDNGLETDFKVQRRRKKKMIPREVCEDEAVV